MKLTYTYFGTDLKHNKSKKWNINSDSNQPVSKQKWNVKSSRKSRNDVVSPKGGKIKIERIETNAKTEGFFKFYNNEKRKKND